MNKYFLLFLTIAIILSDCRKKEEDSKFVGSFLTGDKNGHNLIYNLLDTVVDVNNQTYNLDFNNDGLIDLVFESTYYTSVHSDCSSYIGGGSGSGLEKLDLKLFNNTQVALSSDSKYIDTLGVQKLISSTLNWGIPNLNDLSYYSWCRTDTPTIKIKAKEGLWINTRDKFLAIRLINKDTVYAWLRMDVETCSAKIKDYAYIKK